MVDCSLGDSPAPQCTALGANAQGEARCLQAVVIALGQAEGGRWYVSTIELQLASFAYCLACRGVRTLSVFVDPHMPLSLWGNDDCTDPSQKATHTRTLPLLQAGSVTWDMPADTFQSVLLESYLLSGVKSMKMDLFGENNWLKFNGQPGTSGLPQPVNSHNSSPRNFFIGMRRRLHVRRPKDFASTCSWARSSTILPRTDNNDRFKDVVVNFTWPASLKKLTLGSFNRKNDNAREFWSLIARTSGVNSREPLDELTESVVWPATVLDIRFGALFNRDISGVVWPVSLLKLSFGSSFDQPLHGVVWPSNLMELRFGSAFNQPITNVTFPDSLLHLTFGFRFNLPIGNVCWPTSLESIEFGARFNQPVEVVWPACLRVLTFGRDFNQPIETVKWPPFLEELSFGKIFNKPVAGVVWPAALCRIKFGRMFRCAIDETTFPCLMELLQLGGRFNLPISCGVLPAGLRTLKFGYGFNQPIDANGLLPAGLQQLYFGNKFNQPLDGVMWPASLKYLTFGRSFNQPVSNVVWPHNLRVLEFLDKFDQPIVEVVWPSSLEELRFGYRFNQEIKRVMWPASLKALEFGKSFNQEMEGITWPTDVTPIVRERTGRVERSERILDSRSNTCA